MKQDQLGADRRDARDQDLAQIALDMIFLGVAEAAMGHDRLLAGLEAGLAREILRGIRCGAAGQALVVAPAGRSTISHAASSSIQLPRADAGSPWFCRSAGRTRCARLA
jgi:hypothetical protein